MLTKPLRYETQQDVIRRLHNTFIFYQGKPVYVAGVSDLHIQIMPFDPPMFTGKQNETIAIHSSDTDIDLQSPKIGWANVILREGIPVFFLRTVNRQYSQGIDFRKTYWLDPGKSSELILGYNWRTWQELQPIADMMLNRGYPSIKDAAAKSTGAAFDVDWALTKTKSENIRTLFSDHQPIGYLDLMHNRFVFKKGALTKTRHHSLDKIFNNPKNRNSIYVVDEANT